MLARCHRKGQFEIFHNLLTAPQTASNTHAHLVEALVCANHVQSIGGLTRATCCVPCGMKRRLSYQYFPQLKMQLGFNLISLAWIFLSAKLVQLCFIMSPFPGLARRVIFRGKGGTDYHQQNLKWPFLKSRSEIFPRVLCLSICSQLPNNCDENQQVFAAKNCPKRIR